MIICFFYRQFKENQTPSLPEEKIIDDLADFLPESQIEDEDNNVSEHLRDYETRAKNLISSWTDRGFLRNYEGTDNEILYELSPYTEKVIQWLEQLESREFIGTESRFKDIFSKLQELVDHTTEDAGLKIRELEKQKKEIDKHIKEIQASGKVSTYDDYQIKSRVVELTHSAKELISDFKEVEDNFKIITRNIYLKHTDPSQTKGAILGYTFDSLDELKDSDQGKSFYAFWDFLISRNRQDQWKELVQRIFQVLEDRNIRFDDKFLRKMKQYLFKAGNKVSEANDRMSEKLSRIISEKELEERLKVKEAVNRIKELALSFIDRDELPNIGIEIDENVSIRLPMERKVNLEKAEIPVFNQKPGQSEHRIDGGVLHELYSPYVVDRKELKNRIHLMLEEKPQVTLKEIIDLFPLEKGLSELLAYFSLAEVDRNHFFDHKKTELIEFDASQKKYMEIPQIIFTR